MPWLDTLDTIRYTLFSKRTVEYSATYLTHVV